MTHKNKDNMASHKLDVFGGIDYKKPLQTAQDMRTSTYFGHKVINDIMLGNKAQTIYRETRPYEEDTALARHRTSEYKANYVWKFGDPDEVRNIALDKRIYFMKPTYDCKLKFLKRPMRPATSVSHSDFLWQPEQRMQMPEVPSLPTAVKSTKITIDPNKPGYTKYLDSSTTTSRLDYCYRSPADIMNGFGAKDNITFWNWKDMECRTRKVFRDRDVQLCDKLPWNECIKRRAEFTCRVKPVPNSGLTTEVRHNFVPPYSRALDYNVNHIRNTVTFVELEPIKENITEYRVLGSGDRPQQFL